MFSQGKHNVYDSLASEILLYLLIKLFIVHIMSVFFFKNFIYLFYLFLAVLGLCCCTEFSLVVVIGGYSLAVVRGLLISVQWHFLLWSTGFRSMGFSSCGTWAHLLQLPGSRALVQ